MDMEIVASLAIFLVGVAVLVVIHLCIVGRIFRRGLENSDGKIPGRISNEELKNLPCFNYTPPQGEEETICGNCAVCLDVFSEGDKCRLLPNCNHSFHVQCIDSWLFKTALCPICRTRVFPLKVVQILSQESSIPVSVAIELP